MKLPQIIQGLYFLCQYKREDICYPNSNTLSWKKSKHLMTEQLPKDMAEYKAYDQKGSEFEKYHSLNFINNLIKDINEEDVKTYHHGMHKLWKWLTGALDARKKDITRRLVVQKKMREERELAVEAAAKRDEDRAQRLADEEQAFKDANREAIEEFEKY